MRQSPDHQRSLDDENAALPFAPEIEDNNTNDFAARATQTNLYPPNIKYHRKETSNSSQKMSKLMSSPQFSTSRATFHHHAMMIKNQSVEREKPRRNSQLTNLPSLGAVNNNGKHSDQVSPKNGSIVQHHQQRSVLQNYVPGFQKFVNKQIFSLGNNSPSLQTNSAKLQKTFFKAISQAPTTSSSSHQSLPLSVTSRIESLSQSISNCTIKQQLNSTLKRDASKIITQSYLRRSFDNSTSPEKVKDIKFSQSGRLQKLPYNLVGNNASSKDDTMFSPLKQRLSTVGLDQPQQKMSFLPERQQKERTILSLQEMIDLKTTQTYSKHTKQVSMNGKHYLQVPEVFVSSPQINQDSPKERYLISNFGEDYSFEKQKTMNLSNSAQKQMSNGMSRFSSSDCGESALLSPEKASIIKEINEKKSNRVNFYGQFISLCLASNNKENLHSKQGKSMFETDLDKIKVSSQLLDIIDKQVFSEGEKPEISLAGNNQSEGSSQKQQKVALTAAQKEKLFLVLADSQKIVVHTAQNKELMAPSERKDVVRLAQWLEEMLQKIFEIKEQDFFEYFENVQLVCSACMSELIRQVGQSLQERGSLMKRIWESLLNLMRQAFEQISSERAEKERALQEELKQTHRMYLAKLDEVMPQIATLQKQMENRELQSKRVVLEFRYLRKKDTKLEKYLKLSRKDLRVVEEEFSKVQRDLEAYKRSLGAQDKKKDFVQPAMRLQSELDKFNQNYDLYTNDLKKLNEGYSDNVRNFNKRIGKSPGVEDEIDTMEENIYSKKEEVAALLSMDERIIEEIEGADGIKLIIGHCGIQTGPDLLKMTSQGVDTSTLVTNKDRTTQTFTAEIDVKEVQTDLDWGGYDRSNTHNGNNNVQWGSDSQQEMVVVDDANGEMEKQRREVEEADQRVLDQVKRVYFDEEDEKSQEDLKKVYELPVMKAFLSDSPGSSRNSLVFNWKSESEEQNKSPVISDVKRDRLLGEMQIPKIRESLSDTIRNKVEDDLDELNMLVTSRTSYVTQLCEKIIEYDLLKPNSIVSSSSIKQFIEDSKMLILEENSRLKRIWERSKRGLLELVKSKLAIAEKDIELKEVQNDKVVIEQQIKSCQQVIIALEQRKNEILSSGGGAGSKPGVKTTSGQISQSNLGSIDEISANSLENITDEDENDSSQDSLEIQNDDEVEVQPTEKTIVTPKVNEVKSLGGNSTATDGSGKGLAKGKPSIQGIFKASVNAVISSVKRKEKSAGERKSSFNGKNTLNSAYNQVIKKPKKETLNPLNRISFSLVEAIQQSQQEQYLKLKEEGVDKRFFQIKRGVADVVTGNNAVQTWLKGIILSRKGEEIVSSSPNAGPAALFFNKVAVKYLHRNAANDTKRVILKQQVVLKHIQSIYLDKVKSLKTSFKSLTQINILPPSPVLAPIGQTASTAGNNSIAGNNNQLGSAQNNANTVSSNLNNNIAYDDQINGDDYEEESCARTLNLVTYDYFLNQFGFKKLAETKLRQFLESCAYYSGVSSRIRTFTKLYGFNRVTNFDFEDFDFYARILSFLEDGATSQQLLAGVIPFGRVIEALVKRFDGKIDLSKIKQELEAIKIPDITQKQKNKFAAESDAVLDIFLSALVEEKKLTVQSLCNVFTAGDADQDHALCIEEYMTLLRHVEYKIFNPIAATKQYYSHCDLLDRYTGRNLMSFTQFALNGLSSHLFRKRVQDSFLQKVDQFDAIDRYEALEKLWIDKKDVIRLRFVKHSAYTLQYRLMIKKIDDFFAQDSSTQRTQSAKNQVWFTYRLLDEESKRIMTDALVAQILPEQFCLIGESSIQLIKQLASPPAI